jgi:hypothetical protein
MERLMALDAVAMSTVGLLFGWLAALASPEGARTMRADARTMLADAWVQLRG